MSARQINQVRHSPGTSVWQRNYWGNIRNERELPAVQQYILDNPAHWPEDTENPCARRKRHEHHENGSPSAAGQADHRSCLKPGFIRVAADPFLMMDDFHGAAPLTISWAFLASHRGIETITVPWQVEHGDNMGNQGVIHAGTCGG